VKTQIQLIPCPLCPQPLALSIAHGRKTGKPFVALKCPRDARHFRGFIADRQFVARVIKAADPATPGEQRG